MSIDSYAALRAYLDNPGAAVVPIGPDALHVDNGYHPCRGECPLWLPDRRGDSWCTEDTRPGNIVDLARRWFGDQRWGCYEDRELVERLSISHLAETEFEWVEPEEGDKLTDREMGTRCYCCQLHEADTVQWLLGDLERLRAYPPRNLAAEELVASEAVRP